MNNSQFTYIFSHLHYNPSAIEIVIGIIVGIIVFIGLRYVFLLFHGIGLLRKDRQELERKKKTLGDLILMKDIQTELEKEIELAMLKATFR